MVICEIKSLHKKEKHLLIRIRRIPWHANLQNNNSSIKHLPLMFKMKEYFKDVGSSK